LVVMAQVDAERPNARAELFIDISTSCTAAAITAM